MRKVSGLTGALVKVAHTQKITKNLPKTKRKRKEKKHAGFRLQITAIEQLITQLF